MMPLMLIGGVQCIQFANGSYLTAMGKPHLTLWLTLIKLTAVLPAIIFIPSKNVGELVNIYVIALLVVTPFSFALVAKILDISLRDIVRWIAPGLISAGIAFFVIFLARDMVGTYSMNAVIQLLVFGMLFSIVYLVMVMMMARDSLRETFEFMRKRT